MFRLLFRKELLHNIVNGFQSFHVGVLYVCMAVCCFYVYKVYDHYETHMHFNDNEGSMSEVLKSTSVLSIARNPYILLGRAVEQNSLAATSSRQKNGINVIHTDKNKVRHRYINNIENNHEPMAIKELHRMYISFFIPQRILLPITFDVFHKFRYIYVRCR